jgi:hypothetical protein
VSNNITCGGCNRTFTGRVLPEHGCDLSAFGAVGQDPENFEKQRILGMDVPMTPGQVEEFERQQDIATMARGRGPARVRALGGITPESLNQGGGMPVYTRYNGEPPSTGPTQEQLHPPSRRVGVPDTRPPDIHRPMEVANRQEIAAVMAPMIREAFGELTSFLGDLKADIQAQTSLMQHLDAPMEAVVDSHERAAASFETLRGDIFRGGLDKLEKVLDVSGLSEQASAAEKRMEALAARIEAKVDAAFKSHAEDMVNILHLLERLQARELRETKNRIQRAASSAVRRGPKV